MTGGRKVAAILVADIAGYSRLTGADEERTLARLRSLRSDLIDPAIAVHNGRLVKRTGDGAVVEFRSVVEAVRAAIDVQSGLADRNAGLSANQRIVVRVGIHLGDVVEEADGDLMGDGVNIAARLEGICEPGGICLSAAAYEQVRDRLHEPFADLGEQNLKNIARPVRVYALRPGGTAGGGRPTAGPAPRPGAKVLRRGMIAATLVAIVIAAGWFGWERFVPPPAPAPAPASAVADEKLAHAPRLSIVVLPFANLSGDPEQDYFTDGLTDDLTTDLSHLPDSFVIARNTAFTYKGKAVDVKQIGRDLGVRYALEGSVRRTGDAVTINAQLVSTETGAHIWADRLEGERSKLGALQVEAVARVANALGVQLVQAESLRAIWERPANPDALDLTMRGLAAFYHGFTPENLNNALEYYDRALQLEPDDWRALEGKAEAQMVGLMSLGLGKEHWLQILDDAETAVDRVLAAQPDDAHAHLTKGLVAKVRAQSDVWLAEVSAAIASDRNLAPAYAEKSHHMITDGRSPEAFDLVEQALRLDPHDPGRNIWEWYMCNAHAHLAQWEQAIEWCQKSAATNPAFFWPYFELAAAYGSLGRSADAANAVAELLKRKPDATVQTYRTLQGFPDPKFVSERDRIMEGLRKAGLPEG